MLGLVTEGGQGLATANNGKFVGVKAGTKEAARIAQTRIDNLKEFNAKYKKDYIMPSNEFEVRKLFDDLKEN